MVPTCQVRPIASVRCLRVSGRRTTFSGSSSQPNVSCSCRLRPRRSAQLLLGRVPVGVRTEALVRPQRQLDVIAEAEVLIPASASAQKARTSSTTWASVQRDVRVVCVNWRTRIRAGRARVGSLRWQQPISPSRTAGRGSCDALLKTRTCAGQFIGLTPATGIGRDFRRAAPPSSSTSGTRSGTANMFSAYFPQWPDWVHWRTSISCGALISW